ncbi:MAG TPA: hypothetical protein VFS67_09250 [Polyangiaceae bacterium]|nr:hypothetical protein [Polyangiaceae bacterium]
MDAPTFLSPAARHAPGDFLIRPAPLGSALLIAGNDFWLKVHAPGVLSGKLSDVGLCFFFPLLIASGAEWLAWLLLDRGTRFTPRPAIARASVALAALYYTSLKLFDEIASLHVTLLSSLFPGHHFAAVADGTDLVCLPIFVLAFRYLARACELEPAKGS